MVMLLVVSGMIVYTVGVLTGVYVGYQIHKETSRKKPAPNSEDKQAILVMARDQRKITNDDVQKLLNISDATATRYLDSLEREGLLVQKGKTGQNVYYILK